MVTKKSKPTKKVAARVKAKTNLSMNDDCNTSGKICDTVSYKQCVLKKIVVGSLLIAIGALGSTLYYTEKMSQHAQNITSWHKNSKAGTKGNAQVDTLNEKLFNYNTKFANTDASTEVGKRYNIALYSYKVIEGLREHRDFTKNFDSLKKFTAEHYKNEMQIITDNIQKALTSEDELLGMVGRIKVTFPDTTVAEDSWINKIKNLFGNNIEIRKVQNKLVTDTTISHLNLLNEKIKLGDFNNALNLSKNMKSYEGLSEVIAVLEAKVKVINAANKMFKDVMRDD